MYIITSYSQLRILLSYLKIPIPFVSLPILSFKWWLKLTFSSKYSPKCFWIRTDFTIALLNFNGGWYALLNFIGWWYTLLNFNGWWHALLNFSGWWYALLDFPENISSWTCLVKSGLNDIFHLFSQSAKYILGKELFSFFCHW